MGQFKAAAMLTPAFCHHHVVNRLPTHHNSFKARENNEVVVGRFGRRNRTGIPVYVLND